MLPDRVSNPGPLTYESGALPIALRGPAIIPEKQEPNLMQMIQSWSKGNMNGEIELYSNRSLQNLGFMALPLIALEKQS